jgi:hypothetical protein
VRSLEAPARTAPLARHVEVQIETGNFRDPQRATDALRHASQAAHLVAPAPVCGSLPEGCALALAAVQVDVDTETYAIPGGNKLGLGKTALDKIAGAAGVSWVPDQSRRLDDGSDPHYCHYKAVGRVRDFDGTVRVIQGEVEIDARDGSAQGSAKELAQVRKFILRHAESKAKNRAIRSLGVRTSYTEAELRKPFVVAKVQFTGESSDPEIRKMFAAKTADAFLGSHAALYGGRPEPALPPAEKPDGTHPPPPVGSVAPSDTDIPAEGEELPPDDDTPAATGTDKY